MEASRGMGWGVDSAVFEKEENGGLEKQVWDNKGGWLSAAFRKLKKVLDLRKSTR